MTSLKVCTIVSACVAADTKLKAMAAAVKMVEKRILMDSLEELVTLEVK